MEREGIRFPAPNRCCCLIARVWTLEPTSIAVYETVAEKLGVPVGVWPVVPAMYIRAKTYDSALAERRKRLQAASGARYSPSQLPNDSSFKSHPGRVCYSLGLRSMAVVLPSLPVDN